MNEPAALSIGVYTSSPSPHFNPLVLSWLGLGCEVHVVFATEKRSSRRWKAPSLPESVVSYVRHGSGSPRWQSPVRAFKVTRKLLQRTDVWVLSGSYADLPFLGAFLAVRLSRKPFVFWGERPSRTTSRLKRTFRSLVLRELARSATCVWSPSTLGAAAYEALGAKKGLVVPYPLDASPLDARAVDSVQCGACVELLVVGSIDERKRPALALDVARELRRRGVDFRMRFVGTGPLLKRVAAAARDLPIEFLGQRARDEVRQLMRSSHILLHCSREDGWGMVVAEAAASGMGVVGSEWTDSVIDLRALGETICTPTRDDAVAFAEGVVAVWEAMRSAEGPALLVRVATAVEARCGSAVVARRTRACVAAVASVTGAREKPADEGVGGP